MNLTTPAIETADLGRVLMVPDGARILVVCERDSDAAQLKNTLPREGCVTERARSVEEGCEAVKSGRFHLVVSTPRLADGSWKMLAQVAQHYDLGFEVILWAHNLGPLEWARALNDGAFDVLDAVYERGRAVEATKRALWAAYLKGAGPRLATVSHQHVV